MNIAVRGLNGKMGKVLSEYIATTPHTIVGGVGREGTFWSLPIVPDVIIDFSSPRGVSDMLSYAAEYHVPICIATTGYSEDDMIKIKEASAYVPICKASNTSIGIPVLVSCVSKVISAFGECEVEIVETHHSGKIDSPSGTALMIGEHIAGDIDGRVVVSPRDKRKKGDIGISSVRIGNVVGTHEVIISTIDEDITITHTAHSRRLFAVGAVRIAEWLRGKKAGLYSEEDVYASTVY